ncbi:hypothetical protein M501DRAFT_998134 [Patellaria atrata CBS 101060]|uniref:Uncharacterized protein n=1 Tax=Patellaria atrata CBS 101060 TaxID=1346257 RepID=A0A9P4VQH6_9PEZI|nr:hypothetical protein M501DRAFT_998134 [Patellaria atrata CBS 101060]
MGTPVIDPETDIAYFYAKSYIPNYRIEGETGILNGVYYFYAVHLDTLDDVEGFPILVDGVPADNDKRKYFIGGTILNRPSLTQIGDVVYAGFGSICDQFNYTGTVLAVNVKEKKLVNNFVTQAGLDSAFTLDWTMFHAGGGAGIWQSGMGLSSDGKSLYFVVDNGDWPGNVTEQTAPVAGGTELDVLSEMAVRLEVGEDGFLEVVDHFQPFDFQNDEGMDLGSGGISLLDPEVFHGGDIERMALVAGKSGKIYVLDADNLGGFRQGPNETDGVVQIIDSDGEGRQNGAVYGGLGSYPLDGGYVYSAGVGQPIKAYKLITSEYGTPHFEVAGKSVEVSQDTLGNGIPTVTSFGDAEGSGIVWLTAPLAGLQAWHAIPDEDGMLKTINLPRIDGSIKFSRPTFGDGRVYVFDSKGVLHCLGSN